MASGLLSLPPDRAAQLMASYSAAVTRRRFGLLGVVIVVLALMTVAGRVGEVEPLYFIDHFSNFTSYFGRILPRLSIATLPHDLADWYWNFGGWLKLLVDTLMIAYLGTSFGALGAFALSFFAARNTAPNAVLRVAVKRLLEFCRTVPNIVFALLFVTAFGLGPLPGILAIGIHTLGTLGKLFTEIVENIDLKPVEGVRSAGGNFVETMRFAVVPQVLSGFASYTLLRFEINVREGAVIGIVGAGGIGQDLFVAIRKFYYTDVSAILLMIIVTVAIIDLVTEQIRHRLAYTEIRR
jgi:phosphonate transport system permease protein